MCMALHRTNPSRTALLRMASAICGVMLTNPTRAGMWKVRYSVHDFIANGVGRKGVRVAGEWAGGRKSVWHFRPRTQTADDGGRQRTGRFVPEVAFRPP